MHYVTKTGTGVEAEAVPKEPAPGTAPLKDANPPEAGGTTPEEVPKVGWRDAPGG